MTTKFNFKQLFLVAVWLLVGLLSVSVQAQQQNPNRVLLQGFWWDYWNNNYPNRWSDYLSDLSPRLRTIGISAVWVPPTAKADAFSQASVWKGNMGYGAFDNYDLGDKYQKNLTRTRFGDKNELLRSVGVMHANGIDVIQDIVPNHLSWAGSGTGAGGQDPNATSMLSNSGYKNFRYACYTSPTGAARTETASEYLSRAGRFSKNWSNFYPNQFNPCCTNDINTPMFGPDVSYESNAYGTSSNATYNPAQTTDYMRTGTRNWLVWYKKQTGFDGVRIDAIKHFAPTVAEDFLWNLQNNAGWANGGNQMFAVGEWVGGTSECDTWCANVQNRAGTFDFGLRQELYYMVTGMGNYNIGTLVNYQQQNRARTCTFVNSHDTFRPILDANGNYSQPLGTASGWDSGNELWNGHIDPREPRIAAAYAVIFGMDGTPTVFFEDLFDIGTTSKRFTHLPTSTTDLPQRSDIANLVWCYQNLNFKGGSYLVRWQAADAVVIERSGKALICANDNYTAWQNLTGVQTAFADGTTLKDYSGATTTTRTVYGGGKVDLAVPPCDGTAPQGRRGYAVWAPNGITTNYNPAERTTTQEWEMANDLGDNDTRSLREGGATPNNSTAVRTVGKIYVKSGKPITYNLYPTNTANALQIGLLDAAGTILSSATGTGNLAKTYTPTTTGWLTIKMRNQLATVAGQSSFVKVTYTAPKTPNALAAPGSAKDETDALVSEQWGNEADNHITLSLYPNPVQQSNFTATISSETSQQVTLNIIDAAGRTVYSTPTQLTEGKNYINISSANTLPTGVYLFNIAGTSINEKLIITQ